jgi:hypothetical protein
MARKEKSEREGKGKGVGPGKGSQEEPREDLKFPRWLPAVVYGAVTLLLFRKFVFSGQMLLGQDTLSLGFMARDFFAQALRQGTFPFWNPIILGGTPFLDSLAGGDALYPTSLLLVLMEPFRALGWKLIIHVFGAGLFAYGWIRALGRSRAAALLCGLAYLMAPFMVTLVYPGHDGKLFVTALTPLLFWATERALAGGRVRAFGGMSLAIGLIILTTHFQQAYFLFGAVGVYAAARVLLLWKAGLPGRTSALRFGLFLAFSVLGAGTAAVQLLPAVSYVREYSRRTATTTQASDEGSVAYSSSWSLHPEEVASLVVPEFAGNSAGGAPWATATYWGRNVFKLNHEYAGLVVLLLAVLAFFGAPARGLRLTFLGIGGVALLFALGTHTPVWRIFYEVLPGISLFRAPSIAAVLFGFGAVTLMAYGVDRVLGLGEVGAHEGRGKKSGGGDPSGRGGDRGIRRFLIGTTIFLLFATALASSGILTSMWVSSFYPGMAPGKAEALARAQDFIGQGFFLATLLSAAILALVLAAQKGKISGLTWVVGMGVLLVLDLGRVNDPFIQTADFQAWAGADANVRYLLDQQDSEEPFRVLAMGGSVGFGQDVKPGMYGLELAAGHHPNDLARYRELIGMVGSGAPANLVDLATFMPNLSLLSILNVRYIIWPVYRFGGLPVGEVVMATSLDGQTAYEAVYEIPTLPRARLVGRGVVLNEDETVPYMLSSDFSPAEEVVLSEAATNSIPGEEAVGRVVRLSEEVAGEVDWLERSPNRLRLQVRSESPALLTLAENWYPSWKAVVGGEEVPVLRANHSLRVVPVPAGESEVEVFFDAGTFLMPMILSLVSLFLVCGAVFSPLGRKGGVSSGVAGEDEA